MALSTSNELQFRVAMLIMEPLARPSYRGESQLCVICPRKASLRRVEQRMSWHIVAGSPLIRDAYKIHCHLHFSPHFCSPLRPTILPCSQNRQPRSLCLTPSMPKTLSSRILALSMTTPSGSGQSQEGWPKRRPVTKPLAGKGRRLGEERSPTPLCLIHRDQYLTIDRPHAVHSVSRSGWWPAYQLGVSPLHPVTYLPQPN